MASLSSLSSSASSSVALSPSLWGRALPPILYGTAWKKDRTADLVHLALSTGFRGIDTACQPKHYSEALVGDGIARALSEKILTRSDLFLQTKFTPLSGQDPASVPYDVHATLGEQVSQSFIRSLANLQTPYIDSLLLHSPCKSFDETMQVWRAFEALHASSLVRNLGISNCYDLETLRRLHASANVKPRFLQNRFRKETKYDKDLRSFLDDNGMTYQSFWTLTANPHVLQSDAVKAIAERRGKTPAAIWFAALSRMGIVVLSGTTDVQHMKDDLEAMDTVRNQLTEEEVETVKQLLM